MAHSSTPATAGGNNATAAELRTLGIDSVFFGFGNWKQSCGSDYAKVEQMQHAAHNMQRTGCSRVKLANNCDVLQDQMQLAERPRMQPRCWPTLRPRQTVGFTCSSTVKARGSSTPTGSSVRPRHLRSPIRSLSAMRYAHASSAGWTDARIDECVIGGAGMGWVGGYVQTVAGR